jgi:cyclopropane fatty-acyl-phospholipid synthase-like methyltransferase
LETLKTSEEVFEVAFAYMKSKALFAGLHLGVFDALANGPGSFRALREATGAEERGLVTLLTALVSLGLIERVDRGKGEELFANAPASQAMLVGSPDGDFGDYCRNQIDRQMYPFLHNLSDVLRGQHDTVPFRDYETWFRDASEATLYSESQHSVSLPAANLLCALVDLSDARRLLDVGGGSGAFSITLCQHYSELSATIIDFPSVADVGRRFVAKAGLEDRVDFVCGSALAVDWPGAHDAILFSYVSGSVAAEGVYEFYRRAYRALVPGGRVLVHDFMVDDDRRGPLLPALWALQHAAFTPGGVSLTPSFVKGALTEAGFADIEILPFVPAMTRLVLARKPLDECSE